MFRLRCAFIIASTLQAVACTSMLGPPVGTTTSSPVEEPVSVTTASQDSRALPAVAGEAGNGAVFNIRGAVARQVYRQLAPIGVRAHDGAEEIVSYSGAVEISCTRTGGVLPPGTRGFPAPVSYECYIKGGAGNSVTLKNGAAKRFFGSLAATPMQKDMTVSKSYKGHIVITCRGASGALDGAKCEASKIAH